VDDAYVRALMTIDGDTLELVDLLFARPNGTPKRRPGGQVDLFFLERGRDLAPAVQLCASCPVLSECA
jgi:hypothetical protein